ncbi:EF-hand domain-containing protein [Solimonas sp. K1W22B-7]|nr:EF-hand domain-containing protein [Solimonas sp. K1W22B-7]
MLGLLALCSGSALADCYTPTSALPPPAVANPPPAPVLVAPTPVVVITPAPANPRPMMSDDAKFATLDTSGNGALDRGEVSANSELVTRFRALDKNHDGKMSRNEYGMRNVDPAGGR